MKKIAALLVVLLVASAASAEPRKLVLSVTKLAPEADLARQFCQLVNAQQKRLNFACETRETDGAVESLQSLDGDEFTIAFARGDWVQHAMAGSGPFRDRGPVRGSGRQRSGGPNENLRALFTLQIETFIILARADAGIKSLADLRGKRLNIGPPGSGGRIAYELIAPALGWQTREFDVAAELGAADQSDALCRNRVDAIFYLAAHPSESVRTAAQACDTAFVPVAGREVEALDKDNVFLLKTAIPGGLYKAAPRDVPSLGIAMVATASSRTDAQTIHDLLKLFFDNLARLQRADPVFARLDARRMAGDGLVAPLHEGAIQLYKERGWIR